MGFTINEAAIQAKVSSSASLKGVLDSKIRQWVDSGVRPAGMTGAVLTKAQMYEAAYKMKELVVSRSAGLPISIRDDVQSFGIGDISETGPGMYQIICGFKGATNRPSLAPDRYGGVENIIALFNNGYSARATVYGEWPGYGPAASLTMRPGTHFMNAAVDAFNSTYGGQYHATAELSGDYN